jgi:hypothetical protein
MRSLFELHQSESPLLHLPARTGRNNRHHPVQAAEAAAKALKGRAP